MNLTLSPSSTTVSQSATTINASLSQELQELETILDEVDTASTWLKQNWMLLALLILGLISLFMARGMKDKKAQSLINMVAWNGIIGILSYWIIPIIP